MQAWMRDNPEPDNSDGRDGVHASRTRRTGRERTTTATWAWTGASVMSFAGAGCQRDQHIEERESCWRGSGERPSQGDCCIDAYCIIGWVNCCFLRQQLVVVAGAAIKLPVARTLDPNEQALCDGRCAIRCGDQRVEFGVGEIVERGLDGRQVRLHVQLWCEQCWSRSFPPNQLLGCSRTDDASVRWLSTRCCHFCYAPVTAMECSRRSPMRGP